MSSNIPPPPPLSLFPPSSTQSNNSTPPPPSSSSSSVPPPPVLTTALPSIGSSKTKKYLSKKQQQQQQQGGEIVSSSICTDDDSVSGQELGSNNTTGISTSTTTTGRIPTINPDFIITDPYLSEYEKKNHLGEHLKVLIITTPSIPTKGHDVLKKCLVQCIQNSHDSRAPDLVITPEHWISSASSAVPPSQNREIQEIAKVLKEYHCYGFIGMGMLEKNQTSSFAFEYQRFNAVTVINPQGQVLGSYKKRHPTANENITIGDRVGIFDTIYGRIGVLICFDIESVDILQETLLYKPKLIVNPTFIGGSGLFGSNSNKSTPQEAERSRYFQIKTSLEAMGRNFEKTCVDERVTIIRCDTAVMAGGRGTHQMMTPYSTIYPPSFYMNNDFCFYVDGNLSENDFSHKTAPPPRDRTDNADNVGSRYVMYSNERQNAIFKRDTATSVGVSNAKVNHFGVKFYGHNKYICHDHQRVAMVNADVLFCNEQLDQLNICETFGACIEDIFVRPDKRQLFLITTDNKLKVFTILDDEKVKASNFSFLKFEKQLDIPLLSINTFNKDSSIRKFYSVGKTPSHVFIYSNNCITRIKLSNNSEEIACFESPSCYVKTQPSQQILTMVDYEETTQTLYFLMWHAENKNELLLASTSFTNNDLGEAKTCILSSTIIDIVDPTRHSLIHVQKTLEQNVKHFVLTFSNSGSEEASLVVPVTVTLSQPSLCVSTEKHVLLPQPCTCVLPLNLSQFLVATVEGELLLMEAASTQQDNATLALVRHRFHRIPIHRARRILSMHFNELQGYLVMFHEDAASEGVYQSLTRFGTNRFVVDLSNFFLCKEI
ncbi:hypothetical protein C9374_006584 [Naegleria lovaniensis]|uniref:CN hydrolase domain-containing protein n=1 Tax=Naegleria lovaniensis TaxID=51637 RepID=A0AA88KGT5_NAELO|nr:uncharacterized protein C9374_006584 [Naegleria lovaniensis]KAG2379467.1 hypothetical protein C9374_006584 [Naegleria lovaniensis]